MPKRILIFGGTAEAREIADALVGQGHDVTSSFAGVTKDPKLPTGKIRVGGFGGTAGLRDYLSQTHFDVLLDATHPFAAQMSRHAFEVEAEKLIRFERPAWRAEQGDDWMLVKSIAEAAKAVPQNARVFVTTGRKELEPFLLREDLSGVIRTVEPPSDNLPRQWKLLLDRPPHTIESEAALFERERFTHLVTKNAGSSSTRAKLDVARQLRLPVIMIERPFKPLVPTFSTIPALLSRINT
jgi:precorrin-6A/cobalt-precorrin-6A reductase